MSVGTNDTGFAMRQGFNRDRITRHPHVPASKDGP